MLFVCSLSVSHPFILMDGVPFQIEEGSQNSEQLFEDDGNELEMEGNGVDIERNSLEIEGNGLDIESNGLQNDCDQMLEIEDDHESNGDDTTEWLLKMVYLMEKIIPHQL